MAKKRTKKELSDFYFKILKLDSRASIKEVELAYNVLTQNETCNDKLQDYRLAFEWLMVNVFNFKDDTKFCEIKEEDYYTEEEHYANIIASLPKPVKDSVKNVEKIIGNLSDKAKAIFCTQTVNLPMFFDSIWNHKKRFLWFSFWTTKDIQEIITEACLNPLQYESVTFEMSFSEFVSNNKLQDLRSFIEGLSIFSNLNKKICKKFVTHNTKYGISGFYIAEEKWSEKLKNMMIIKADHCDCYLNLVS